MKTLQYSLLIFSALLFRAHSCSHAQTIAGIFPTIDASFRVNEKNTIGSYQFYALPLQSLPGERGNLPQWLLYYGEYSINHNLGERISFAGAYVFQLENNGNDETTKENRAHFQLKYSSPLGKASVFGRIRSDNRFISAPEVLTKYAHRLRFMGGFSLPIKSWTLTAYEELFFNTPTLGNWNYAENWAAIQLKKQVSEHLYLEAGPLFITWKLPSGEWFRQYYLQTTLVVGL